MGRDGFEVGVMAGPDVGARSIARDRLTLTGFALAIGGSVVAAALPWDASARVLPAVIALLGLVLWVAGPLREGRRRRGAGVVGPLASTPVIAVLAFAAVAAVAMVPALLGVWALR